MSRFAVLSVALLLGLAQLAWAQGKIEQARQDVRGSDSSHPGGDSGSKCPDDDDEDDPYGLGALVGGILSEAGVGEAVGYALLSPFIIPRAVMGDTSSSVASFPRCPYPAGHPAYLWMGQTLAPGGDAYGGRLHEPKGLRSWSIRGTAEAGGVVDNIYRLNARFVIDTTPRLGVMTNWNWYWEDLGRGRSDQTTLGDTEIVYRFAQCEYGYLYTGGGVRVMTDCRQTRAGWGVVYGGDFFPAKPVILSGQVDCGGIGDAFLWHVRGTVGVQRRHCEAFAGYDFLRLGHVNFQGPLVGLRLWF